MSRIFNRFSVIHQRLIRRHTRFRFCTQSTKEPDRTPILPSSLKSLGLTYLEQDELRQKFDEFDTDHNGSINLKNAAHILISAGKVDPTEEEAQALIDSMDADHNGNIEWKEFEAAVDRAAEPVDKRVIPLGASLLMNFIGQGAMQPILPLLARSYGLAEGQLGLVTGMTPFIRLLVNVPATNLAQKIGRRPLTIVGPIISAVAFTCFGFSTTFAQMATANAILGVGSALSTAAVGLYLADISTPKNRARTNSPITLCVLFGLTLGPAVGGFLAETINLHSPFFLSAFACTLCSALCFWKIPETMQGGKKKELPSTLNAWKHILEDYRLIGLYQAIMFMSWAQGSHTVAGMLYCIDTLEMTPGGLGFMMTANVIAMGLMVPTVTKLSDRLKGERHRIMIPALLLQGIFVCGQPLCATIPSFFAMSVASFLCVGAIIPNINPFILDCVIPSERAGALALRNTVQDLGLIVGGGAMGFFAQAFGVPMAMTTTGCMVTTSSIILWRCMERAKKKS